MYHKFSIRYPFLFNKALKRIKTEEKSVYLTFDDGPNIGLTEEILKLLSKYNAKATFFCVGKNAIAHPELLDKIKKEGHSLGNHSMSHQNSFKVPAKDWMQDVLKPSPVSKLKLFRPPYGKMRYRQYLELKKIYTIVLWDVLSHDFRPELSVNQITDLVINKSRNGSIIVFHDNLKFADNMLKGLKYCLDYFSSNGFKMKAIH